MTSRAEQDRVKLCLSCDRLIPFDAAVCPLCGNTQPTAGKRKACVVCSASIPDRSIYCSECGCLAVRTVFMSNGETGPMKRADREEGKIAGLARGVMAAAAMLFEGWMVLEVLGSHWGLS